ncbi:sporulation protein [Streptomyces sp. NPDC020298]|uniref:sporulation protein n=1 Tax=unclassified Streptomyces TaxID=2593676 RepID=UPI0033DC7A9E
MGLRQLFGFGDDENLEPAEIDTQIQTVSPVPGGDIGGEIVLRGGGRGLKVEYFYLRLFVTMVDYQGRSTQEEFKSLSARRSHFTVAPGAEERVPFHGRLPWTCPVTELGGRSVGTVVSLKTQLDWERESEEQDHDLVHVAAPPLYESVLDAFAQEGYLFDESQVIDDYIPDTENHPGRFQTFVLADRTRGDRLAELEVAFHCNEVGAMVYVRRAERTQYTWEDKPPARRFPAAHHEVGRVDFREHVRRVLAELALLDS